MSTPRSKVENALANTPPPLLLKGAPNEFVASARTPQPAFAVVDTAQSVPPVRVPEKPVVDATVQPDSVCSVTWLLV